MSCKICGTEYERQPWKNQREHACNACRAKRMQKLRNEKRSQPTTPKAETGRVRSIFDWRP